jgi:hypothetical protein
MKRVLLPPWYSCNLNSIGTGEQHGGSRVYNSQAVSVVRNLHQNHVPEFVDESAGYQAS